mmetsp:Transcript_8275/g.30950  ORF Transcript_8275/g.30950 Transcript_8275/m.30950 type:complete len:355 (+) Transcript_8275:3852-4916(+)
MERVTFFSRHCPSLGCAAIGDFSRCDDDSNPPREVPFSCAPPLSSPCFVCADCPEPFSPDPDPDPEPPYRPLSSPEPSPDPSLFSRDKPGKPKSRFATFSSPVSSPLEPSLTFRFTPRVFSAPRNASGSVSKPGLEGWRWTTCGAKTVDVSCASATDPTPAFFANAPPGKYISTDASAAICSALGRCVSSPTVVSPNAVNALPVPHAEGNKCVSGAPAACFPSPTLAAAKSMAATKSAAPSPAPPVEVTFTAGRCTSVFSTDTACAPATWCCNGKFPPPMLASAAKNCDAMCCCAMFCRTAALQTLGTERCCCCCCATSDRIATDWSWSRDACMTDHGFRPWWVAPGGFVALGW